METMRFSILLEPDFLSFSLRLALPRCIGFVKRRMTSNDLASHRCFSIHMCIRTSVSHAVISPSFDDGNHLPLSVPLFLFLVFFLLFLFDCGTHIQTTFSAIPLHRSFSSFLTSILFVEKQIHFLSDRRTSLPIIKLKSFLASKRLEIRRSSR